jgi:hypothetical protein
MMKQGIASVTQLRMTNEEAGREGVAEWKWEMRLFRVDDWQSPRAPM